MIDVRTHISGEQQAQGAALELVALLEPQGAAGQIVRFVTLGLHRYSVAYAHVDTGAMRAAIRPEVQEFNGLVYVDPVAQNPKSNTRPAEYAVYEHERGGEHAWADRAVEHADALIRQAQAIYL